MTHNRLDKHLRITVAALTRRRPQMVQSLLVSWGKMDLPENCDVRCLIVENDDEPRMRPVITAQPVLNNGVTLDYVLEIEAGIPFGRNRAAKEALAHGDDLLVFVDDDETVAQDWLVKLVNGYRNSDAVLLGGPVPIAPPSVELTNLQAAIHDSLTRKHQKKEKRAQEKAARSTNPEITIATNNWIAETRLFSDENIWFDENMRFTGGEDTKLYQTVKAKGFVTGWVEDAYAYETLSIERLSFRYQFQRARAHGNTSFHRKLSKKPQSRYTLFLRIPVKVIQFIFLALLIPFVPGDALLKLAQKSGIFYGKLTAALGKRPPQHYSQTTGY